MTKSLEEYVAESTRAYEPSSRAIQNQLDALGSNLNTATDTINRNYAQQQAGLNRQRNMAAETASMQAAGSGGSFGGAANIANRKYYDQAFVPAVTQMRTNQTNELAQARQDYENQRTNLNSQLANLQAEANRQALAQYYADQEAERNRALQQQQIAAQNAYNKYLMDALKAQNQGQGNKAWDFGNGYKVYDDGGEAIYTLNGNEISRGKFLEGTGGNTKWDLWNDIWNSGTRTNGIGSDTIQAYKNWYGARAPYAYSTPASLQNSSKYGYLY